MSTSSLARRESRLRRQLRRDGYALRKSRARAVSLDDHGGYMILDVGLNAVVAGGRFDLDLADVEDWLAG